MAEPKTRPTTSSANAFIAAITDAGVRHDCRVIAEMMAKATKAPPKMWGASIVGFGTRAVQYANGREADWMIAAFSPRKQNIVLYLSSAFPERDALLKTLGRHSCGKGCVYIKRLSDVHLPTLRKLVAASVKHTIMPARTFKTTIVRDGSMCFIPLTFDPKEVFGKVRAPVKVTLNGYTYRSTIAAMGGPPCIPLRKSNREAAGLDGGETIEVRLDLDTEKREVEPPADLRRALKSVRGATERWKRLSYSHQREHVEAIEGAKKPETRARRIAAAVGLVRK